MVMIMIFGVCMVWLTVFIWWLELQPFLQRIKFMQDSVHRAAAVFSFSLMVISNICLFVRWGLPLIIDLILTLFLVSQLGFAGGVIGGIIGLALSNGISIVILAASRKRISAK